MDGWFGRFGWMGLLVTVILAEPEMWILLEGCRGTSEKRRRGSTAGPGERGTSRSRAGHLCFYCLSLPLCCPSSPPQFHGWHSTDGVLQPWQASLLPGSYLSTSAPSFPPSFTRHLPVACRPGCDLTPYFPERIGLGGTPRLLCPQPPASPPSSQGFT